ncbi:LytTR family DNA-binding domain-containing protein [Altererythrobacter sp. ZODW24]|uniref:LytTR family DNA-binding domain-containing protein n=1 Tax=Altererythrobacter sp. ZODW24 TaxID=2185142 RepID=UPI0013B3D293|nr:LytTR family DNA-binding domain-containing protein [Altererythrobacter sp. ZODW24]
MSGTAEAQEQAQDYQRFIDAPVRACEAVPGQGAPADFTADGCYEAQFYKVDPQGREVWVEHIFKPKPSLLASERPLGLFVGASASTAAFLNGVSLGSNGIPGPSPSSEVAGDMDAVFFVPEGTLRSDENRLLVRMSSMHGAGALSTPIHVVTLAPYRDPRKPGVGSWIAIVTLGLFLTVFVFFGVSALRGKDRELSATIALASLAIAFQLAGEAMRDLIPYPYPLHIWRLTAILAFAMVVNLSLLSYVLQLLFKPFVKLRYAAVGLVLAIMLVIAVTQAGYDYKTQLSFIAATIAAGCAGLLAGWQGERRGWWIAGGSALLAVLIWWLAGMFLDLFLYYMMAALLLWLLFRQARRGGVATDEATMQAEPEALQRIELTSSGKVEFVDAAEIVRFSGAGDYVEVLLTSGRSSLYNGSLAALERELPEGFIRIHRSHIVNATLVKSLERESAGTGQLLMSDGSEVPVSRRNMANVRDALTRR